MIRKPRKPNAKPSEAPTHIVTFLPHEFARFKHYPINPKPDIEPKLGGYQRMVNFIFDNTDRSSLVCIFPERLFARLQRYIKRYGKGGPQRILRDSCTPALRRIGIELSWS
jgi:hypothetical protein